MPGTKSTPLGQSWLHGTADHGAGQHDTGRRQFLKTAGVLGGAALGNGFVRPAKAATTELRFLNVESQPAAVAFLKATAAEYESKTGVRVSVETIVGTTTWTKVTTAIKTGKPYDVITFPQPMQTVLLAQEGQLAPITDIVKDIGLDDFGPGTMVPYKNDLWYLAYNYNFCCLYYRKDWLDEHTLSVPTNWAEFSDVVKTFTDSSKRRFGTSLPYSIGVTPWGNTGFFWANAVKFYDNGWNVLIDTPDMKPKVARALDLLSSLNPYNAPGQFSRTFVNMTTDFIQGTAGIVAESGGLIQDIENKSPDDIADKFVIGPYPAPDGGKGAVTYGGKGFGVGKSPNTNAALDFLRWFMKTKMIDFALTMPMYMQPAQFSTYNNPRWQNNPTIKKYWPSMQTMRSFMDTSAVNVDAIQFQGSPITVNQGLLLNSEVILNMYQNVLTKKMTISDAIDNCAAEMRKFTRKDA